MDITIKIPTLQEVFQKGISLKVVRENESWYQDDLGEYAKKSGVYIHHSNGNILYVGQTSKAGNWGTFHVRLRKECQPAAASHSNLYHLLLENARDLKTTLYHFEEVSAMFSGNIKDKLSPGRMTLILEQFMIAAYQPSGNRR